MSNLDFLNHREFELFKYSWNLDGYLQATPYKDTVNSDARMQHRGVDDTMVF